MPGISLIYNSKGIDKEAEARMSSALDSLVHFDNYKKTILSKGKTYVLGANTYPEYPIDSIENDNFLIYIEGQIYGKDRNLLKQDLLSLANIVSGHDTISKERIANWLLDHDGEYLIIIFNKKTRTIAIINDILARLPLYYSQSNDGLLISREVRFIASFIDNIKFDKMAMAQYLLFKYQLGDRTLIENVHLLKPAMLIQIDSTANLIKLDNVYQFNFDERKHAKQSVKTNVGNLVSLFNDACKNRAAVDNEFTNILALSGGLDSRSVGGSLRNQHIPFLGVTQLDVNNDAATDARIAEELAKELNIDWKLINLDAPTGKELLELLKIKNGLNYFGMSFMLPFAEKIRASYGDKVIYFTGDGGQVLKQELRGDSKKLKSFDELVDYAIYRNKLFSIEEVLELTHIKKTDLLDEVRTCFTAYPEKEWNNRYFHFMINEENVNHCFEGEDRNRFYFWSSTPFYSIPFFQYANNCPDRQIARYIIYREFIKKLSPELANIDYARWNMPITSKKINLILLYHSLPSMAKKLIRRQLKGARDTYSSDSMITKCCKEQIGGCKSLEDYFNKDALIKAMSSCPKQQSEVLFTLTSAIEDFTSPKSTLERYSEEKFR